MIFMISIAINLILTTIDIRFIMIAIVVNYKRFEYELFKVLDALGGRT